MQRSIFFEQAVNFVHSQKGSLPKLARETNLDYNWLRKLNDGLINDPGVKKIERLLTYASKKYHIDISTCELEYNERSSK
jgi:hypothetical protein